jgi:hypothetical protein
MTLVADYQADYAYQDGAETVTFTDLDNNATASVNAVRTGMNYRETILASGGAYQPTDTVWELWESSLGSEIPVAGCKITDSSSVVYTIITATEIQLGGTTIRWRCIARKQR